MNLSNILFNKTEQYEFSILDVQRELEFANVVEPCKLAVMVKYKYEQIWTQCWCYRTCEEVSYFDTPGAALKYLAFMEDIIQNAQGVEDLVVGCHYEDWSDPYNRKVYAYVNSDAFDFINCMNEDRTMKAEWYNDEDLYPAEIQDIVDAYKPDEVVRAKKLKKFENDGKVRYWPVGRELGHELDYIIIKKSPELYYTPLFKKKCNKYDLDTGYSTGAPIPRATTLKQIKIALNRGGVEKNPGPNQRKKKNGGKKKRQQRKTPAASGTLWRTPSVRGFPDCVRTKLRYTIPLTQLTGGGTTNSFRYTSNAYDVDAALGSTAMPFFAEYAVVYSRFRTLRIRYCFRIENQEAFPCQIVFGIMTQSLGSTSVGANYAGNPYMSEGMLTAVNGSHSIQMCQGGVSIAKLFGDKGAYYDDLYTGSTTSSTLSSSRTANLYIGSVAAAVPVNGQFVSGWVELDLLFDRRNSLIV